MRNFEKILAISTYSFLQTILHTVVLNTYGTDVGDNHNQFLARLVSEEKIEVQLVEDDKPDKKTTDAAKAAATAAYAKNRRRSVGPADLAKLLITRQDSDEEVAPQPARRVGAGAPAPSKDEGEEDWGRQQDLVGHTHAGTRIDTLKQISIARGDSAKLKIHYPDDLEHYIYFNFPQMLFLLSLFREQFARLTSAFFKQADIDNSGFVDIEEFYFILRKVGTKSVNPETLEDIMVDFGLRPWDGEGLDKALFQEAYRLHRSRAGFTNEELHELEEAYERFSETREQIAASRKTLLRTGETFGTSGSKEGESMAIPEGASEAEAKANLCGPDLDNIYRVGRTGELVDKVSGEWGLGFVNELGRNVNELWGGMATSCGGMFQRVGRRMSSTRWKGTSSVPSQASSHVYTHHIESGGEEQDTGTA